MTYITHITKNKYKLSIQQQTRLSRAIIKVWIQTSNKKERKKMQRICNNEQGQI